MNKIIKYGGFVWLGIVFVTFVLAIILIGNSFQKEIKESGGLGHSIGGFINDIKSEIKQ